MKVRLENGTVLEVGNKRVIGDLIKYQTESYHNNNDITYHDLSSKISELNPAKPLTPTAIELHKSVLKRLGATILTLKDVEEMNTLTRAPKCKHQVGDRVALHIEGHGVVTKVILPNNKYYSNKVYKYVKYVCKVRITTKVTSLHEAFKFEIM